jgi:hypothetical protein
MKRKKNKIKKKKREGASVFISDLIYNLLSSFHCSASIIKPESSW